MSPSVCPSLCLPLASIDCQSSLEYHQLPGLVDMFVQLNSVSDEDISALTAQAVEAGFTGLGLVVPPEVRERLDVCA